LLQESFPATENDGDKPSMLCMMFGRTIPLRISSTGMNIVWLM